MTALEASRSQDKVVILKRVPVFAACSDEQLHFIADRTRLMEYKKGEYIFREGDKAEAFYIVSSGRLRIFSQTDGKEKTLATLHNSDFFGEMALLVGEVRSATAQALNDTLVLQLEKRHFDAVINRIPSLVLYLSRSLSKRLRMRDLGVEFSEATIAAVYSAVKGIGRTYFAVALAASLVRETRRDVIIVDCSGDEGDQTLLYGADGPRPMKRGRLKATTLGAQLTSSISTHPLGFRVLSASTFLSEPGAEQMIAPLLSFLVNRYAYVLIDLPVQTTSPVFKALTQSDLIYLLTGLQREHMIRTNALIQQLQSSVGSAEQRIKVVVNMVERPGDQQMSYPDIAQHLGQPIAFVLPRVTTESGHLTPGELTRLLDSYESVYAMTIRRIARELGGMLVGLALGSGAALGLAHIGILKVLEREKIPIDMVAGSSIGAVIGGLWASGRTADELEEMAKRFSNPWDIRKLFLLDLGIPMFSAVIGLCAGLGVGLLAGFWTGLLFGFMVCVALGVVMGPIAGGPIQGARLMEKLEDDFAGKRFEDTRIPLKIVASNPMAREKIVFTSGRIADAVRASVSIPGIFKPVILNGKICLDGGVMDPVPVSVLKEAGVHHVIAVNVFPTTHELIQHRQEVDRQRVEREARLASRSLPFRLFWRIRQEIINSVSPVVFDIIMRSMQAMEYQISEVACREADMTLRPTLPGAHWLQFFHPEPFIRRGEEEALQYLPELKRITGARDVDNA